MLLREYQTEGYVNLTGKDEDMNKLWNEISEIINNSQKNLQIEFNKDYDYLLVNKLGVEEDTAVGQVITNIKGIIIDNTIRILGSGRKNELASIEEYNYEVSKYLGKDIFIIADDVFGGIFALKKDNINADGMIYYLAPDTLEWENLEITYFEFLSFFLSNKSQAFYKTFIWSTFSEDVKSIKYNQGILIYPYLWAKECNVETASKKIVPLIELIQLNAEYRKKFGII